MKNLIAPLLFSTSLALVAQPSDISDKANQLAAAIEPRMMAWRHDLHQHPELSNREYETSEKMARHLKKLGIEVSTGVAKTGVVGLLRGGHPGPVIALRADMDALPVTERNALEWASDVQSIYNDVQTGVMHACGHDTHMAILMAVAEVLASMKQDLKGTVKFIFQPAEEGAPPGEEGGAQAMVREGVLTNPDVDIVIGLHINAQTSVGEINYKPGGTMAAADRWVMKIQGKQSHGSRPWTSIDPIVTAAEIVTAMQTVISRNTDLTKEPAVLSVGLIRGGVRNNIIPEEVEMIGTIRTLDTGMQDKLHEDFRRVATNIAEAMGATIDLEITPQVPVTYNDPALTKKLVPYLENAIGAENVKLRKAMTGAEDFSYFANEVPGFFFFVGGCPEGENPEEAAPHHTPDFFVADEGMLTGLKCMLAATLGYMYHPDEN